MGLDGWMLGRSQFPFPVSPLIAAIYAPAYNGVGENEARMGGQGFYVGLAFAEGWAYFGPVPVETSASPEQVVANVSGLLANRGWEEAFEAWPQIRQGAVDANRKVQAVDVAALDDAALSEHLGELVAHHGAMIAVHHLLTSSVFFAVSWYLMHGQEWAGASAQELMPLLVGYSTVSRPDTPECRAAALAAGPLLHADGAAAELVRQLQEIPQVAAYIDDVRCRVVDGFDLGSPRVEERPELIVERLRVGASEAAVPTPADPSAIRERVPAEHRAEFDAILAGARRAYEIRDERGVYSDAWSLGLLRRGLQEVGRRLGARGKLDDWQLLAECSPEALATVLVDPAFDQEPLRVSAARRAEAATVEPPPFIGQPPAPPSLDDAPASMVRFNQLIGTVMMTVLGAPPPERSDGVLAGVPASPGTVEGVARVLSGPQDMFRLEPGDILVTATTTEAFNAAVHLVAGIVTDHGGINSHAGIVAREAQVPAVVGCGNATTRIPDGARIRVDGSAGTVQVL